MQFLHPWLLLKFVGITTSLCLAAPVVAEEIAVSATLLKIIETVEIPAQQSGVLSSLTPQEGTIVDKGEVIAQVDATEKVLEVDKAKVEYEIAKREAANDVNIRFARKSLEVATAELLRSEEALSIAEKSISQTEMDRLRLIVEKNRLEVEQSQEKTAIATLTAQLRQTELRLVEAQLAKHEIKSPIQGMVVSVFRRPGEWIDTSDPVAKVVRIDRLRAEGFIANEEAMIDLVGAPVQVTVDIPRRDPIRVEGKVVFVDPEVDPVNGQVRIWAEVENRGLRLRPGLRASMTIEAPAQ